MLKRKVHREEFYYQSVESLLEKARLSSQILFGEYNNSFCTDIYRYISDLNVTEQTKFVIRLTDDINDGQEFLIESSAKRSFVGPSCIVNMNGYRSTIICFSTQMVQYGIIRSGRFELSKFNPKIPFIVVRTRYCMDECGVKEVLDSISLDIYVPAKMKATLKELDNKCTL